MSVAMLPAEGVEATHPVASAGRVDAMQDSGHPETCNLFPCRG
jgi:hypothetical protein